MVCMVSRSGFFRSADHRIARNQRWVQLKIVYAAAAAAAAGSMRDSIEDESGSTA